MDMIMYLPFLLDDRAYSSSKEMPCSKAWQIMNPLVTLSDQRQDLVVVR